MYPQQPQQPQYPPPAPQQPPAPQAYAPPAAPPQPQFQQPPAPPQFIAPPAPQYPPQYAPPMPQAYPPQGYPPQGYGQPPMPPPVPGTLDQFYSQPSTGGGKSLAFEVPGTSYTGIVTRPVGNGDIQQQTDTQGRPATFRDGRPKFVMKVPLQMQPTPAYPDGLAQWYVKGNARDELVRAMAEAGAPEGPPEAGAIITITMTGTRPSGAGMNPTKLHQVLYQRPQNAPNGSAPVERVNGGQPPQYTPPQTATTAAGGNVQTAYQPAPPPVYATNGNGAAVAPAPPAPPQPAPAAPPPPPPAPVAVAPPVPPPPAPAATPLTPEQQALLAQLTGQ